MFRALSEGAAVGGVPTLEAVGASVAETCGFSYYNALAYCGTPWYPGAYYWGCYSGYAFGLGLSWGWGTGSISFYLGSPYWWAPVYSYCYPYYSWACGGWRSWGGGWGWGWGWGGGYWGGGYPVYVYEPSVVYYPVYVEGVSTATSEVVSRESATPQAAPATTRSAKGAVPEVGPPSESAASSQTWNARMAERYVALGDVYFQAGRFDRALEAYERAVKSDPKNAGLLFVLSDAYFANARYADAANAIREGLRADPALVESTADKRKIYGRIADFDAQMDVLKHSLDIHPTNADAWLVLGYNHFFRGEYAEARKGFLKAKEFGSEETKLAAHLFLASIDLRLLELESPARQEPGKK